MFDTVLVIKTENKTYYFDKDTKVLINKKDTEATPILSLFMGLIFGFLLLVILD